MLRSSISALYCSRFCLLRVLLKRTCSNFSKVKVISVNDEEYIKISFRYGSLPPSQNLISLKTLKDQHIGEALSQIKFMVNLQRRKETIRRVVTSKYSDSSIVEAQEALEDDDLEVNLLNGDGRVKDNVRNVDAWTQCSLLKIGGLTYEISYNIPTVLQLSLPEFIIAGCMIRPHFLFECASANDSAFSWHRSLKRFPNKSHQQVSEADVMEWQKVSEGILYVTSAEDVGHKLKLVCTPKMGAIYGVPYSTVTPNVIEAGPHVFPFEERQMQTKDLVDSDCVRCVSYNVLANCYVEPRRYPYASRKARDVYYRKQILLKELLGYNSDILCLQEVQERTFLYDLQPMMERVGFDGFYVRKGGRRYEGLAAFYRKTKFKAIYQHGVHLNQIVKEKDIFENVVKKVSGNFKDMSKLLAQDTALLMVLLEHVHNPKHKILVANTHLYSNKDKPEVRLIQAALCSSYLENYLQSKKSESPIDTGLIFCGDFNSLPESAAYDFMINGSFECSFNNRQNNSTGETKDTMLRHNLNIKSACGTPAYTNYTEEFNGCLDYIFYSEDTLSVTEVVPMPKHEDVVQEVALPSEQFCSDHLALVCTLKWKKWSDNC